MEHRLRAVVSGWINKIHKAWQEKQKLFGEDAEEAMMFFNGPYDWLYGKQGKFARGFMADDELPPPSFRMTVNKVAELVQLFGPALYHSNPVRKVNPRKTPQIPPEVVQFLVQTTGDQGMMLAYQQMMMQEQAGLAQGGFVRNL